MCIIDRFEGEELKDAIRDNIDILIPKHIIVDDMFASVNYYEQMQYPGQRVQIDVKFVPKACIVNQQESTQWFQYTFLDEYIPVSYTHLGGRPQIAAVR